MGMGGQVFDRQQAQQLANSGMEEGVSRQLALDSLFPSHQELTALSRLGPVDLP